MSLTPRNHTLGWLNQELPKWEQEGIVTVEAANHLRQRYQVESDRPRELGVIMISVLGIGMISAGVISLFAYNWDELGRLARAAISFLPLLIMQVLAWYALTRWKESSAVRESVGVGWIASIGACIALIAQTYQMADNFSSFLVIWFVLGLPVVYLMRSGFGYTLAHIGLLVWVIDHSTYWNTPLYLYYYPLFLGVTLPYYFWIREKPDIYPYQPVLLKWVLAAAIPWGTLFWLIKSLEETWTLVFALYFSMTFLIDQNEGLLRRRPFALIGILGIAVLMLIHSLEDWNPGQLDHQYWFWWILVGGMFLVWLGAWIYRMRRKEFWMIASGSLPVMIILDFIRYQGVTELTFTFYTLLVAIVVIVDGFRKQRLLVLNYGFLLLCMLALFRFFDSSYGFLEKGIVFIVLGGLFVGSNLYTARRFKRRTSI